MVAPDSPSRRDPHKSHGENRALAFYMDTPIRLHGGTHTTATGKTTRWPLYGRPKLLPGRTHTRTTGKTARWLLYGHPNMPSAVQVHTKPMFYMGTPLAFTAGPTRKSRGKPRADFHMATPGLVAAGFCELA